MTAAPETASLREFATLAGFRPSYITQLKADGRLILTADGRRVQVAASLARIEATRDPAKAAVAARHAAARTGVAGVVATPPGIAAPEPAHAAPAPDPDTAARAGSTYQSARAVRERFLALQAKLDYEQASGKLLPAAEVESALATAITTLRGRLESMPDTLGPQLAAEADEARCRALLAETIEHLLDETARAFHVTAHRGDA